MTDEFAHPIIGPNGSAVATIDEAAAYVGVSRSTLYQMLRQHVLPFIRINRRRRLLWDGLISFVNRGSE